MKTPTIEIPLETHTLLLRAVGYALGSLHGLTMRTDVPEQVQDMASVAMEEIEGLLNQAKEPLFTAPTPPAGPIPR